MAGRIDGFFQSDHHLAPPAHMRCTAVRPLCRWAVGAGRHSAALALHMRGWDRGVHVWLRKPKMPFPCVTSPDLERS